MIIIMIYKYDQKSMQQENRCVALYTELRVFNALGRREK